MIKSFLFGIFFISVNANAGSVEVDWGSNGTTGVTVLSAGLLGPNETVLSKCFDDARRLSNLLGENTIAQVQCTLINNDRGYTVELARKNQ